jgi:hypothetical protein
MSESHKLLTLTFVTSPISYEKAKEVFSAAGTHNLESLIFGEHHTYITIPNLLPAQATVLEMKIRTIHASWNQVDPICDISIKEQD